jgi:tRNA A37 threonylcarbamoyladenosine dehydratase
MCQKVAIVGVGGTGSYALDLVAKTPVDEIHLFDGDIFFQQNAFRFPGAPSLEKLQEVNKKTTYLKEIYSKMRRNIFSHDYHIDAANVSELSTMTFVFLCVDKGPIKKFIVAKLIEYNIPFIDVGVGVIRTDNILLRHIRTTTCTHTKNDHLKERIPFADGDGPNDYSTNIQIADLNALNAALAVIKWKKLLGFYHDASGEFHSLYSINDNKLFNEDFIA